MNPIYTSELLKDDNIDELINKYKKLSDTFTASIQEMKSQAVLLDGAISKSNVTTTMQQDSVKKTATEIEKLTASYVKTKNELDAVNAKLKALTEAKKANNAVSKAESKVNDTVSGSLNNLKAQLALNKAKLNEMTEAQKKNSEEGYKLQQQTDRLSVRIANLTKSESENIRIKKLQSVAASAAKGSFEQLSAQHQIHVNALNKMSDAERRGTKAGKELETQTKRIYEEMKRLQSATGPTNLNVGNYASALNGVWKAAKNLLGVYIGLSAFQNLGSQLFGQTKELDSLNKAYEKIIPNTQKLARANDFLGRLSDSYGLNLIKLRSEYLKYTASAQASTLSLKDQELVFESVAKASSTLGLSTETQSRAFTALQQIMSKGKVSAEELKGQLGDALPGAVTIMAKALGVGVGELSKMLEQGQVLADEALPKFAIELQKAYGVEGVSRIDNLAAAQSRFESEITKVIQKLDATDAFKNFFNTMASGVKFIGDNIKAIFFLTKAVVLAGVAYGTWKASLAISNSLLISNALLSVRAASAQGLLNGSILLGEKAMKALRAAFASNPIGALVTVMLSAAAAFTLFNNEVESSSQLQKDLNAETQKRLVTEKIELQRLLDVAKNENASKESRQKAIEKINSLSPEYLGNLKLETINTNEAKTAIDKYIESLELRMRIKAAEDLLIETEKKRIDDVSNGLDRQVTTWQKVKNAVLGFGNVATSATLNAIDGVRNGQKANEEYIKQVTYLKSIIGDGLELDNQITNTVTTTNTTTSNDKTDPYKVFELQIEAMQDGFEKELALLKLNNEKKKDEFKKYGLDTKVLTENLERDIISLKEKYAKIDQDLFDDTFKEKLSYLEDGIEKEMTALYFEYSVKARTTKDKAALDKWYFAEYDKLLQKQKDKEKDGKQESIKKALDAYDLELQLKDTEFSLLEKTEKEKTDFKIEQEKLRLKKILELNEQFGGDLSEIQKQIIENQIKALEKGSGGSSDKKEKQSIYDLIGIDLSQEKQQALTDSLQYAKDQLMDWAKVRTEIAQQNIDTIANEISSIENRLQIEIENRNANRAHSVETVTKELQDAKKAQETALRERKKAQQQQLLIESVQQASSLVTASAKIWATLGFPLAVPALGLMWGSFIASKVQAANLTKKAYGDGGYEEFDYGGSHASGNDIQLGYTKDGKDRRVERGETMAIFNKRSVSKYGNAIKSIVSDINRGNLEKYIENQTRSGHIEVQNNIHKEIVPIFAPSNDMRNVESELVKIRKQNEVKGAQYFTDKNGNVIRVYKNVTSRYV